jgi:hypothetical protein
LLTAQDLRLVGHSAIVSGHVPVAANASLLDALLEMKVQLTRCAREVITEAPKVFWGLKNERTSFLFFPEITNPETVIELFRGCSRNGWTGDISPQGLCGLLRNLHHDANVALRVAGVPFWLHIEGGPDNRCIDCHDIDEIGHQFPSLGVFPAGQQLFYGNARPEGAPLRYASGGLLEQLGKGRCAEQRNQSV